jgi:hypothetical protein
MDLVISGGEDALLKSLDFKLPPSSSYVQQRRLVSYYPSGASTFSPNGVRVCRFNIVGDGWLDPASLRVYFKLANNHGTDRLSLAGGPHVLFSRLRLFIGGTLVEDLDYYGRSHELLRRILMPPEWVKNDSIESLQVYQEGAPGTAQPEITQEEITAGNYAMLNFAPLLGVMACGKYLPIRLSGGMQLELTLADGADAISVGGTNTTYELQQMSLRCAISKLDSALESSFSSLMMQNKALTLKINTFHTQSQALPAASAEVNVSMVRAFSRLNALFVSFTAHNGQAADLTHQAVSFINPAVFVGDAGGQYHQESTLEWDAQIGSLKYPESPATSIPETFSLLRQAVAIHDESIRTLNITPQSYSGTNFVIGVPLQNVPGGAFTGLNTRSGDLLTFRAKNVAQTAYNPGRIFVSMISEQLIEIREGSVAVLD